jgi:hypothetical protein
MPLSLVRKSHKTLTEIAQNMDKELLDGLERRGFKLDFGEDGTGWQFKYLTRGGGYYFNVGCSDLIVKARSDWRNSATSTASWRREHACAAARRLPPI